jgi:hypothetical protein
MMGVNWWNALGLKSETTGSRRRAGAYKYPDLYSESKSDRWASITG